MENWENKVVVVTGGSQGLGFEIALQFARQKALVVIAARDANKLNAAEELASAQNLQLQTQVIDVTEEQSVDQACIAILEKQGRIDVWVNNVGKSTRAEALGCPMDAYRELMELNFYSVVRCSQAVMPLLKETSGHLVNIGSLASKTGWPFVAPYATSKHAMAAFHHQLRLEGPDNVHFLLVCPGPIQRSDAGERYREQSKELDAVAAQPGGGVNMKGIPPQKLAAKIEVYCRKRRPELVYPGYSRLLFATSQLLPSLGDWLLLKTRKSK